MSVVLILKDSEAQLCELHASQRRSLGLRAQLLGDAYSDSFGQKGAKHCGVHPVTQPRSPHFPFISRLSLYLFYWDGFFGSLIIGILALFAGL